MGDIRASPAVQSAFMRMAQGRGKGAKSGHSDFKAITIPGYFSMAFQAPSRRETSAIPRFS